MAEAPAGQDYAKCSQCGRPMRKRGVTLAEAPGTVAYGNARLCKSDAQPNTAEFRGRQRKRGTGDKDARVQEAAMGLQAWLNQRHRRGVAPESGRVDGGYREAA